MSPLNQVACHEKWHRQLVSGVALRYVLPVLRMTSRLAVMGMMLKRGGHTTTVKQLPRALL